MSRYGDSSKSYTVALVCPDRAALDRLGARLGKLGGDLLRDKASVTQNTAISKTRAGRTWWARWCGSSPATAAP